MTKDIVWIEDDINIIDPVVEPLEKAGYRIHRLYSVNEALESIELLKKTDLILLDMIMPTNEEHRPEAGSYSGKDLLHELRFKYKIDTPVIVFSVVRTSIKHLEKLEIEDFIVKPVRPSDLKEKVEKVFQRKIKNKNVTDKMS